MNILVIDDHPLVLGALKGMIESMGPDVRTECLGSAQAASSRLRLRCDFDLVLLDLHLADGDGLGLLSEIRDTWPALPVLVISGTEDDAEVAKALAHGAMGFVPKRANPETLWEAIRLVLDGGVYVPKGSIRELAPSLAPVTPVPPPHLGVRLTKRQTEVLGLLLRGFPNKAIAKELGLSGDTVKDHVQGVLKALGVNSRTQAVIAAKQWGLGGGDAGNSGFGHTGFGSTQF